MPRDYDEATRNLVVNAIKTLSMDAVEKANSPSPVGMMSLKPVS